MGVLVAAAVAISAINGVHNKLEDHNNYNYYGRDYEYKHEDSYRAAAGWLVLVAISAILYHPIGIVVRILYYSPNMPLRFLTFTIYAIAVSRHAAAHRVLINCKNVLLKSHAYIIKI